ncbi:M14 family zinc carboxypeptidase [Sorangium cellulosum]|uniref:M14 family zinc carboxypeptidase n=1 Tax=Sorangium cellulosum TaxID=56 RepID=UPI000A45D038|nr:M14 family zinc carboxypeptidase [Sorangium cellulosum]
MSRPRAALAGRAISRAIALISLLAACQAPAPGTPAAPTVGRPTPPIPAAPPPSLVTEAERTGFQRTGRYAEVERLCPAFEQAYPGRARCFRFGTTPEGRPMLAIAASADGALDPAAARAKRRPVILFQGGIHAGEIDGKDGGFLALRELLDGAMAPGALAAVTAVFVPVVNVDGHERFRPNQRPNQRGPEEMGFRTTGQNLNLNRDHMKAEAPEMRAMLALLDAWDPVVQVDLHATDGAKFQHDVAVIVEPSAPHPGGLDAEARGLSEALQARLSALGHLPLPFYPSFRTEDDPSSGIAARPGPPRFSQSYSAARNRVGVLVETHSWATHARRVRAVHDLLAALFERVASGAGALRAAADRADAAAARLAGAPFVLKHRVAPVPRDFPFRGFAYEKRASDISGGTWIRYDESRPEIWRVPLFDRLEPDLTVTAPAAGYVVPAAHAAWVADKLRLHGVRYELLPEARPGFAVEAFRADAVTFEPSFEGRTPVKLQGAFRPERLDLPRGSLFVPIAQPRAPLVLHLLEPLAPDSLVAWGFFNAAFERKEYMEAYVAEEEARKMLAADPALRAEFEARLRDPAFAKDSAARLDFFYRRHPSWDERVNLVPVFRVAASPLP